MSGTISLEPAALMLIATRNTGKLEEFRAMLAGYLAKKRVALVTLSDISCEHEVDETATSFEGNAAKKALEYAEKTGLVTLADDSGLEVDALGGEPGVYSARYAGEPKNDGANNAKLLAALANVAEDDRAARFVCALALALPPSGPPIPSASRVVWSARGVVEGKIGFEPRGSNGFGYDPLFYPTYSGQKTPAQTLAELSSDEKHALSHRGKAVLALRESLDNDMVPLPFGE